MKRSRIFISHAGDDDLFANLLVSEIRKDKRVKPWIDTEHIITGVNILEALREGLSSMDIFVILVSSASLHSRWVREELECALRKQVGGEDLLILPLIIDSTTLKDVESLHPFLLNRRIDRISPDQIGAAMGIEAIRKSVGLPQKPAAPNRSAAFHRDFEIEQLVKTVRLGDWDSALRPAFTILAATDDMGNNELFRRLACYQNCPDEDIAWGARMTMETLVDLAPNLFDRKLLVSMSRSSDFSVRASAASICLVLAQVAPDRVPVDVAMKLGRHDEDWYVKEPAIAALKSICKSRRNVLYFFFATLDDPEPDARSQAARALRGIAAAEPEILDREHLNRVLNRLRRIGDKEAATYIAEALQKVKGTKFESGYKYGLGG